MNVFFWQVDGGFWRLVNAGFGRGGGRIRQNPELSEVGFYRILPGGGFQISSSKNEEVGENLFFFYKRHCATAAARKKNIENAQKDGYFY
jgi:hypothetical protein